MEKVLPEDVYEVTRNADTERPLQENIGITDDRNLLLYAMGNKFRSGANFSKQLLAKFL
jgi:hypothetical protein